jgi:aspartokinase-like uncharacterized kinase
MNTGPPYPLRVIKVGGSLLTWKGLKAALPAWIKSRPKGINLLLFGGGECVEAMRELDGIWKLEPETMHWRCVRLLDATFEIARELWPEWLTLDSPLKAAETTWAERIQQLSDNTDVTAIVQISSIYTRQVNTLPHNWATTTDSIAAHFAQTVQAKELILLKSASPPNEPSLKQLADSGYVDAAFPDVAPRNIPIHCVDLTSPGWPETILKSSLNSRDNTKNNPD